MAIRIRNWSHFQHYKDRRPPWIKLHREMLDDPDWHSLPGDSAKVLISLWLIASDADCTDGTLPDMRKLAFRLRMPEKTVAQHLIKLSQWLTQDDSDMIADCLHVAVPETEAETEKRQRQILVVPGQPGTTPSPVCPHSEMQNYWNELAEKSGLRRSEVWPQKEALARWKQDWFRKHWGFIFQECHENEWCKEHHAGPDHVLREANARRYYEEVLPKLRKEGVV